MSHKLINRSEDLKRLKNDGYNIELSNGYLIIGHIPYVNENKLVKYGTIASTLDLATSHTTAKPSDHVALWVGDYPCNSEGAHLSNLVNSPVRTQIREGLTATYSFSQKPPDGYNDYYHKMITYIRILVGEASALEPSVTAIVGQGEILPAEDSVFHYADTASSRTGILAISKKLEEGRIAIIGLGGTGTYILDHIAKTPIKEIHLFDDDVFLQHNVFRSPGVLSSNKLAAKITKVERFTKIYSQLRKGIIPHLQRIEESNVSELDSMTFVFLCVDNDEARQLIISYLTKNGIPFIDVGIGLYSKDDTLGGSIRITTCTPSFHGHAAARCFHGSSKDDNYSTNIQISEMNALAAAFAIIKWKKMCKFYHDFGHEHYTVYGISTNTTTNEEVANETKDN